MDDGEGEEVKNTMKYIEKMLINYYSICYILYSMHLVL